MNYLPRTSAIQNMNKFFELKKMFCLNPWFGNTFFNFMDGITLDCKQTCLNYNYWIGNYEFFDIYSDALEWLGTIDAISLVDCSHGRNQSISVGSVIFGNFEPIFTTIKSNSLVHFENSIFFWYVRYYLSLRCWHSFYLKQKPFRLVFPIVEWLFLMEILEKLGI